MLAKIHANTDQPNLIYTNEKTLSLRSLRITFTKTSKPNCQC